MMMCEDILALQDEKIPFQSGFCFLDAGPNAGTMRKVLRFCVKRNFKKVLVIDPQLTKVEIADGLYQNYIVPINPIDYEADSEAVEGHLMDTVRVLFSTKDPLFETIIRKYLPKVFRALHEGRYTLPDAECFTIPIKSQYEEILSKCRHYPTRQTLYNALTKATEWREFQSTARRLDPFFSRTLKQTFGCREGVDFQKLVSKGWIILVNLFPGGQYSDEHSRLLGIVIINEIVRALLILTSRGHTIPYGIFIDEAGLFVSRQLSKILDYYRHLNIRFTFAHQRFGQIEDPYVLSAIRTGAKNKVMFYTSNHGDRYAMCQDMNYGGKLPVAEVTHNLGDIRKQEAVVRIGKQAPVLTRMKNWPDPKVSNKEVELFLRELIISNPDLYRTRTQVWEEVKTRFAKAPSEAAQPQAGTASTAGNNPEPNIKHTAARRGRQKKDTHSGTGAGKEAESSSASEGVPPESDGPDFSALLSKRRKKQS